MEKTSSQNINEKAKWNKKLELDYITVAKKAQRKQKPHNANKKVTTQTKTSQRKQKSHNANKKVNL